MASSEMPLDLEKAPRELSVSSGSSSSTTEPGMPTLEPIRTVPGNQYEDILEDLEHAITPDQQTAAEREAREPITYTRTGTSFGSTASRPPDFEVVFEENDPEYPKNWSLGYRIWLMFCVSFSTWVVVVYSTSFTSSAPGLEKEFGVSSTVATLGMTTYLMGLAIGSLIVAPLSELFGRQKVYVICLAVWIVLIIPCGLAQSLTTILVVRFFGALFGSALISNGPGSVVDISQPDFLALAMSLWGVAPLNGPVTGPIIGGFVYQYLGWRWENWIAMILGAVALALMLTLRETYAPAILKRKAARIRKEMDDPRWWCQYDQKVSSLQMLKVNLSRPFILFATEPILWFMNVWISLVYGILYLCFVAYPIVFTEYRGWSPSISGLAFIGMGIGTMISICAEPLLRRIILSQPRDPDTGRPPPEATASVMAIGAILTPIGQLVFSWTCLPTTIHWAIPIAFGIPFGAGNTISFIYASQYLAASYGIWAASALAGNALTRSMFGATLPLAGAEMYARLTPQWAGTLLGLMEVALIPIPFVFWRCGAQIRAKSRVIRHLREEQDKLDAKRAKGRERLERRRRREAEKKVVVAEDASQEHDAAALGDVEEQVHGAGKEEEETSV